MEYLTKDHNTNNINKTIYIKRHILLKEELYKYIKNYKKLEKHIVILKKKF